MAKKKSPGGTPATVALTRAGIEFTLHEYAHDPRASSYGLEAAEALGARPGAGLQDPDGHRRRRPRGRGGARGGQLDLKALARALGGSRASMADKAAAERSTGYVAGGISPIGQKRSHPTVVDSSALEHETVYVSAGRRGLDLEIGPADLVRITEAILDRVGRD